MNIILILSSYQRPFGFFYVTACFFKAIIFDNEIVKKQLILFENEIFNSVCHLNTIKFSYLGQIVK